MRSESVKLMPFLRGINRDRLSYPRDLPTTPPTDTARRIKMNHSLSRQGKRGFDPTADAYFCERAFTMSPDQSQYIWRKTISHIEVVLGSGVFPVLQ